ncbi:MAG: PAS domain S-box protein [bacterium]
MISSFFDLQSDYIHFLTGLAFFVLSSVCFCLRRIPTPLLSWASLGWFGVMFGGCQWIECAATNLGALPILNAVHSILFAGAVTCLLLFSMTELLPRWVSKPWLRISLNMLPLVFLVVVIEVGGVQEYELAIFLFLAAIAIYCARRMWQATRFARVSKSALGLATTSMILMALVFLLGAPKDDFFPASVLNRERFAAIVGFPITYVYIIVPLLLAASLWQAYQYASRNTASGVFVRRKSWFGLQMACIMVSLACGGWVVTQQAGEQARKEYGAELMVRAMLVTAALDVEPLRHFSGTLDDLKSPEYSHLRDIFTRIRTSSSDVRNIYLYGPKEGKSINYVSSSTDSKEGWNIVPGTVYADQIDEEDRSFFQSGVPYVSKPYTDRWGTWVSALIAVVLNKDGPERVKLALGLDVSAADIERRTAEARFGIIQQIAMLSVILIGFFQFRQNWWDRTRQFELNQAVVLELSRQDFASFPAALEHVAQTLASSLDVESVSVWKYIEDRSAFICEESYSKSRNIHECGAALLVSRYPGYYQALKDKPFLSIPDIRVDERTHGLAEDLLNDKRIISLLHAPVSRGGKIQGMLCVEHAETIRSWTNEEIQLILAIVDMLALLIAKDERKSMESQKYESEERYRRVFEHSPEAIMVLDGNDRLVELNRRALSMVGFPAEALVGQAISDWPCFIQESRLRVNEQMRLIKESKDVAPCELELLTSTGERREGLLYVAPLHGQWGNLMGNLVIIADITQNKQGEAILKGTLKELERHNRLMTGRETRILELKHEVNQLQVELGRPPAYQSILAKESLEGRNPVSDKQENA